MIIRLTPFMLQPSAGYPKYEVRGIMLAFCWQFARDVVWWSGLPVTEGDPRGGLALLLRGFGAKVPARATDRH